MLIVLQIIVICCFIAVIIALFREKTDFLTYSVVAMFVAVIATFLFSPFLPVETAPEGFTINGLILSIEWEVVVFLIAIFGIVEILHDKHIFQEIALRITNKFHTKTRSFFWVICLISTLSAAFIEDLSVAIIFIPMIISTSEKMKINPAPILLGMTICINLAATLTPFGSAQNILIANDFGLNSGWFFTYMGTYFLIGTFTTLFLLDRYILKKNLTEIWVPHCDEYSEPIQKNYIEDHELVIVEKHIDSKVFYRNLTALIAFFLLLILIPNIIFVGLLGFLIFLFINPRKDKEGTHRVEISHYLSKIDYKLIFFFICLFILLYCMEVNGTIKLIEDFVKIIAPNNLFLMSILILIMTSLLSGFLDNVPVTVLFIPIIGVLSNSGFARAPLLIAFILGINLGGNILPQGSAADMMTLELSTKYCVDDMNYKRLLKVGGLFALLHIVLGIGYLALIIFLTPV
ncbi:MAG: SLC13 family permease [Promethearchaeota archaeon]